VVPPSSERSPVPSGRLCPEVSLQGVALSLGFSCAEIALSHPLSGSSLRLLVRPGGRPENRLTRKA
jgi:hypothetical protein